MERFKLIQRRLAAQGYDIGQSKWGEAAFDGRPGPLYHAAVMEYQRRNGLDVDGIVGPDTEAVLFGLPRSPDLAVVRAVVLPLEVSDIPDAWMPPVKMDRIIVHWTAGTHKATDFDRQHYHVLMEDNGRLVRGIPTIDANANPIKPSYAAHTLNLNGGSIGLSLCCMGGATVVGQKVSHGRYPITQRQWDALPVALANLCKRYRIPVTRKTVLSHAEVQLTLGKPQRGKWDIAALPLPDTRLHSALAVGDTFRARALQLLERA